MAPMTRDRAIDNIPQPNMKTYYQQRATDGGLIITEGTVTSKLAQGWPDVPGIFNDKQVEAWKSITAAVHDKGGIIFNQIWHCGRASTEEYNGGKQPVSSSAIAITQNQYISWRHQEYRPFSRPRALELDEIPAVVDDFRVAAANAIRAGFDGVEIHGANGYLIDQFLKDEINKRTDEYGGPIENRVRFALKVVDAVAAQIGSDKVGLRLSPFGGYQNATDSHTYALNTYWLEELNKRGLAYVHLVGRSYRNSTGPPPTLAPFRAVYKDTLIVNGNYSRASGNAAIENGEADLVAYGRPFLANPDLVKRFELVSPLNRWDHDTFYAPGDKGYIDYTFLGNKVGGPEKTIESPEKETAGMATQKEK